MTAPKRSRRARRRRASPETSSERKLAHVRARARADAPALMRFLRRRQRTEGELAAWGERRTLGLPATSAVAYGEALAEELRKIQARSRRPVPVVLP